MVIVHSTIFVGRVSPQNQNKTRVNHIHCDYIKEFSLCSRYPLIQM